MKIIRNRTLRRSKSSVDRRSGSGGIQRRLLLLVLAVLLPILFLQSSIYYERFQMMRESEFQSNLEISRAMAGVFEELIHDIVRQENTLGFFFKNPEILSREQKKRILETVRDEYSAIQDLHWVGPDGLVTFSTRDHTVGLNFGDRKHLREITAGKEWTLSELIISRATGLPVFAVSRGIRDDSGRLVGVVVAGINPEKLERLMAVKREGGGEILLIDREGRTVTRYPHVQWTWEKREWFRDSGYLQDVAAGREVEAVMNGPDGRRRVFALTPVGSTGWAAGASRPEEEVMAPVVSSLVRRSLFVTGFWVLSILLAVFVSRTISTPVRKLQQFAIRLGQGRYGEEAEVRGPSEVQDLVHTFNVVSREIRAREAALNRAQEELESRVRERTEELESANESLRREIEERRRTERSLLEKNELLESIFSNIHFLVAYMDTDFNFIRVNHAYACADGNPPEYYVGRNHFHLYPNEENEIIFRNVMSTGIPYSVYEKPFQYAANPERGITYWDWSVHPVKGEDGICTGVVLTLVNVTDRRLAQDKLKRYAERLEQSNKELQEFAFVASHDLQEPLRKIQAFSSRITARYTDGLDSDAQDYLERIQKAAGRMQSLIRALLSYSRVTSSDIRFDTLDLNRVVAEVLNDLELVIERSRAVIEVGTLPAIEGNDHLLSRLFQNLVENALKFSGGRDPVVRIRAQLLDGSCTILVEDNGIGFDEKYLDRIFSPFQRLHNRITYDGTGMGLAICRKIVERHGGSITAKSTSGEGSVFIITLPEKQRIHEERGKPEPL